MYDCVIGGGGHNGLVCANYLARAGWRVLVLEVDRILVTDGTASGVRLVGGEEIPARRIASNLDPHLTFEKLIDGKHLPQTFRDAVGHIDYSSASLKINLAVSELPNFTCLPNRSVVDGNQEDLVGPQHCGTIHIGATSEYLERAYDDAKYGCPSTRPIVEMTIPTSVDRTLAPAGQHILSLFVQYAPYRLAQGTWDEMGDEFADRCINEIARYAPNVPASILHRQVLTPLDLERTFGLTGGNIFQGAMSLHQMFSMRPVPGWSDYRTPVSGLYVCGSAAHPGGGRDGSLRPQRRPGNAPRRMSRSVATGGLQAVLFDRRGGAH